MWTFTLYFTSKHVLMILDFKHARHSVDCNRLRPSAGLNALVRGTSLGSTLRMGKQHCDATSGATELWSDESREIKESRNEKNKKSKNIKK